MVAAATISMHGSQIRFAERVSAMSQRKPLAIRKKCGRIDTRRNDSDRELLSPTEIRRLVDAAGDGMRDGIWSSMIGKMHLSGKLSAVQYAAGKRWVELVEAYSEATCGPRPPRTVLLDAQGGTPADPDSEKGVREAKRDERASLQFLNGRNVLRLAGPATADVMERVCVHDQLPAGLDELNILRNGLGALSAEWNAKRKARR
jgi:hypothetical protein